MHSIDNRVSVKYNNRPFIGIITMLNGISYVLPLTSQTTQERQKAGRRKRSAMITTFVKDRRGVEIANILHNNMIPVPEGLYTELEIDAASDTYEANEIRYIRKNKDAIIKKAQTVYESRTKKCTPFLEQFCCDFENLEAHYMDFFTK